MKFLSDKKYTKIMGIDPSSNTIACSFIVDGVPVGNVKVDLGAGDNFSRLYRARKYFSQVLDIYKPDFVAVEQTILIQNPQTTRVLSYTVGVLMGEVLIRGIALIDVPPATWKSFIGVKPLTASWKASIVARLGDTEGRKEIQRLKKSQLQDILAKRFPEWDWSDNDISDATGIGLWAFGVYGKSMVVNESGKDS